MDLSSGALWGALGAIIFANILLSGDNAVVIAMAARSLPKHQQGKAIFWGSAAAIILRVILTIVAVQLLQVPYLTTTATVTSLPTARSARRCEPFWWPTW
jgi:predicted tellurium resistance membrane protein TerC